MSLLAELEAMNPDGDDYVKWADVLPDSVLLPPATLVMPAPIRCSDPNCLYCTKGDSRG